MLRKMQQRVFYYSRKTLIDHFSLMAQFQSLNKAFEKIPIDGKALNVFNFVVNAFMNCINILYFKQDCEMKLLLLRPPQTNPLWI